MLAIDRQNAIKQMLKDEDSVSILFLSQYFNVTGETIRRDFDKICAEDPRVIKIYGGAYIAKANEDTPYNIREVAKKEEKRRIASFCFHHYIHDNECVMLDGSTTSLQIANLLAEANLSLTVITNGLAALQVLSGNPQINIINTGGIYSHSAHTFFGQTAITTLNRYRADVSFISSSAIDINGDIMDSNEETTQFHINMLNNSKEHHLVIDSNKFGRNRPIRLGNVATFDSVITDNDPGEEWAKMFLNHGVELVIA